MEFDALVVKESPGLCRCCLSEGCYKDLGSEYQWMNDTEVYADMLFECFDISITQHNDGPNGPNRLICEVCITRLRDACNFKKQVLESEKKFIDMIGRKEFKPQVLVYQSQIKDEDKMEDLCEDAEVEYLEDDILQFGEDDHRDATDLEEPSMSEDITVTTLPVKGKRGRPKKNVKAKTEKAKVPRVEEKKPAKVKEDQSDSMKAYRSVKGDKDRIRRLVTVVLENSTIMPFKWFLNRYRCFYCMQTFTESSKLKKHTKTHTDINLEHILRTIGSYSRIKWDASEISCKLCPKTIWNFEEYLYHAREAHDLQIDEDIVGKYFYVFNLADDSLTCLECGEMFGFFNTLLKHTNKYHSKINKFVCNFCGLSFTLKGTLVSHIKNLHSAIPNQCKICRMTLPSVYKLTQHYEMLHNTGKFKCPICSKVLASWYMKKRHLGTVHDVKTYQFPCGLCSNTFADKSKLSRHRIQCHLKEKTATCHICGHKSFPTMLNSHMTIHDSDGVFQCGQCDKVYRKKKSLRVHKKKHEV